MTMLFRCCALLLSFSLPLAAQQSSAAPAHSPDGGSSEHFQSVIIGPKTNAAFTATVVTQWVRVLEDGTHVTLYNHRTVARDGAGRVLQERRYFTPHGDVETTGIYATNYFDPVLHTFTNCNHTTRTCMVYPYNPQINGPASLPTTVTFPNGAGKITREDLGQKTIESLAVIGSREITTINPGKNGYL